MIKCYRFVPEGIPIEDEGMEDLETFNAKFGNSQECFEEMEVEVTDAAPDKKTIIEIEKEFSLEKYFSRILSNKKLNKQKLVKLIKDLVAMEYGNLSITSIVAKLKKGSKKEELLEILTKIIGIVVYNNNN